MKFRSLVASLLPAQYREQVLGDIEERGFRLADVVKVLPYVWASHVVRTMNSPAPHIVLASDAALRARTEQLARQGARVFYAVCATIWTVYLPFRQGPQPVTWQLIAMSAAVSICAIPAYYAFVRRALPESMPLDRSRAQLLTGYRQQLDYQITTSKGLLYGPPLIVILWLFNWYKLGTVPTNLVLAFSVAVAFAVLAERRISRLHRELESQQTAK